MIIINEMGIRIQQSGHSAWREEDNPATGSFKKTLWFIKLEGRRRKVRQFHKWVIWDGCHEWMQGRDQFPHTG